MNQTVRSPLDQYQETINKVFTFENMPAILALIHSFKPKYDERRIKDTEFETIAHAGFVDGTNFITDEIIKYVNQHAVLPVAKVQD